MSAPTADWNARAAEAQAALIANYLRPIGLPGLGVLRSPPTLHDRLAASYWWQALLLDALLDAQQRTPNLVAAGRIRWLLCGQSLANGGTLRREYYDDMAWMALALLRTGRRHAARRLWQTINAGWNDHHSGGIPWRAQQPYYKNMPAVQLSAMVSGVTLVELAARIERLGLPGDFGGQMAARVALGAATN